MSTRRNFLAESENWSHVEDTSLYRFVLSDTSVLKHVYYMSPEEMFRPADVLRKWDKFGSDTPEKRAVYLYKQIISDDNLSVVNVTRVQNLTLTQHMRMDTQQQLRNPAKKLRAFLGIGCEDLALVCRLKDCHALGFHVFRYTTTTGPEYTMLSCRNGQTMEVRPDLISVFMKKNSNEFVLDASIEEYLGGSPLPQQKNQRGRKLSASDPGEQTH